MNVVPCGLPADTVLERSLVEGASYADSYRVPLSRDDASVVDLFFAVFGHHPAWLKAILLLRHRVGAWCGLRSATVAAIARPRRAATYHAGDDIGPWRIYFLGERELVAGGDNRHLDFRVSVLRQDGDGAAHAVVSTVCRTHNRFGRVYLRVVVPFHRWGVQRLLWRASTAGRL